MALKNAFGDLSLEATQKSVDSHLGALQNHLPITDGKLDLLHGDLVSIKGGLPVTNLPTEYPLPVAQVTELKPQTDALTETQIRSSDLNVADSGEREYIHAVATVVSSGSTTVYTPSVGKRIRVRWIYLINDPTSSTAPLIRVLLGTQEVYRVYALSKRQMVSGAINAPLIIDLSAAGSVAVTVILEEI